MNIRGARRFDTGGGPRVRPICESSFAPQPEEGARWFARPSCGVAAAWSVLHGRIIPNLNVAWPVLNGRIILKLDISLICDRDRGPPVG